ncbi:hypothetical protein K469DRAFT_747508 [Zopfia rhizophila CBS 207.26]|uniref:Transcription factor domain-containing protein n=1 Tax=Zopfia rhizophila CBS 207.26 TaxID=1314779 RepID=A0A6A6EI52_9PEZI|nr:hypothetical protein K469DRAFT_747508 [Zopfia rhizophila CBS 207.26]
MSSPGIQEPDIWMSKILPDMPPASGLDHFLQAYLLPDTTSWLDGFQAYRSPESIDFSFLQTPGLSVGSLAASTLGFSEPHVAQPERLSTLSGPCSTQQDSNNHGNSNQAVTEEHWQLMQDEIAKSNPYILPPRNTLYGFISRYFNSFHHHQPFLQESTWSPNASPISLVLAVCANVALYSLEHSATVELHRQVVVMMSSVDAGISELQSIMLITAFAVWSGDIDDLQVALQFHGRLTLAVRREWAASKNIGDSDNPT